jgi:hypothetical protein
MSSAEKIPAVPASAVQVIELSLAELLGGAGGDLAIDRYQRPYVWGSRQIMQLVQDLKAFFAPDDSARPRPDHYYLGTVLLHRAANCRNIIDGQQRLTTLCLLYHTLHQRLPARCGALEYHQHQSHEAILNARGLLHADEDTLKGIPLDLFEKLRITLITVDREDLAFTFFDTQNSRGVPLNTVDLLKAFHLRAIEGDQALAVQTYCAQHWEALGSLQTLFSNYLWRARRWQGHKLRYETRNLLLDEFEKKTRLALPVAACVSVYPGPRHMAVNQVTLNPMSNALQWRNNGFDLGAAAADWPASLRQPIERGLGFFLYSQKYSELFKILFAAKTPENAGFYSFYEPVIKPLNRYLKELYQLACLLFADRFGVAELRPFVLWLDYALGHLRLIKQSIHREAPLNYLSGSGQNLLDVIANAYLPEEVIEHLKNQPPLSDEDSSRLSQIKLGEGVQGRYLKSLVDYYRPSQPTSAKDRKQWIVVALGSV